METTIIGCIGPTIGNILGLYGAGRSSPKTYLAGVGDHRWQGNPVSNTRGISSNKNPRGNGKEDGNYYII